MLDDGQGTSTTNAQRGLEKKLTPILRSFVDSTPAQRKEALTLKRELHVEYLHRHLGRALPEAFTGLDSSQTWIVYWTLHSLALLEAPLPEGVSEGEVVEFLKSCQNETGGFGGGPGQISHLASTYAAVMSLVTIGTPEALAAIDRPALEVLSQSMQGKFMIGMIPEVPAEHVCRS